MKTCQILICFHWTGTMTSPQVSQTSKREGRSATQAHKEQTRSAGSRSRGLKTVPHKFDSKWLRAYLGFSLRTQIRAGKKTSAVWTKAPNKNPGNGEHGRIYSGGFMRRWGRHKEFTDSWEGFGRHWEAQRNALDTHAPAHHTPFSPSDGHATHHIPGSPSPKVKDTSISPHEQGMNRFHLLYPRA